VELWLRSPNDLACWIITKSTCCSLQPGWTQESRGRKALAKEHNQNYCLSQPSECGADLNRNYTFAGDVAAGRAAIPVIILTVVPSPASEPKCRRSRPIYGPSFPTSAAPIQNDAAPVDSSGVFLDIHSFGELVLWPWGYTASPAPNHTAMQTLGRKYAYFTGYTAQQSYVLYPTDGDSDGFAYGELGVAGYTIELGDWFFQDCATFEGTLLPTNLPALKYMAKAAAAPYLLPAGPETVELIALPLGGESGAPVRIRAVINDRLYPAGSGEPMQDIAAAEYSSTPLRGSRRALKTRWSR